MRVLVAPDKFAGTLTAVEAASAIADGWRSAKPDDVVVEIAVADGGPGFVDVLHASLGGELIEVATTGPDGAPVDAQILMANGAAYVEVAAACGLHLTDPQHRDAEGASSAGVADLLLAALDAGATRVVVGVGGTATTDGGRPAVERFRELRGEWPTDVGLVVATDVDNPLLGELGAAAVFGPQKGANQQAVQRLDHRLAEWAQVAGGDPNAAGAGAGGGLGFALFLLGGQRVAGIDTCLDAVDIDAAVAAADLVITGEGSFDFQSLRGKVVSGVAQRAEAKARPCVVLAGRSTVGRREAAAVGITEAWSVVDHVGSVELAMSQPYEGLSDLGAHVAAQWSR